MHMEKVFKLAINKQMDELKDVVDDYIEDNATHSELLNTVDELKDLVYLFDNYMDNLITDNVASDK